VNTRDGQDYLFDGTEGFCEGFCGTFFDCDDCSCADLGNSRDKGGQVGKMFGKKVKQSCGVCNSIFWGLLSLFTSVYFILDTTILLAVLYYTYPIYGPFLKQRLVEQYNILIYAKIVHL
jgi:hypothetical protein